MRYCNNCSAKSPVGDEIISNGQAWEIVATTCPVCGTYQNFELTYCQGKKGEIEAHKGKPIKQVLIDEFARLGKKELVAKYLGVSITTIEHWCFQENLNISQMYHVK